MAALGARRRLVREPGWAYRLGVRAVVCLMAVPVPAAAQAKLRSDVEAELGRAEAAYRAAPGDAPARRAYAAVLFKLGNVWQARDVIAPLATRSASDTADLALGARLALLASDYGQAESLYARLKAVAEPGSEARIAALKGLAMVYYQTNRYAKAKDLELPDEANDERGIGNLLTFMKRFEGTPYRIEWASADRVAELPIVNDFTPGGALPLMNLEINGHPVQFILDTGGDRLYLDEGLAAKLGIRTIAKRRTKYAYTKGQYVEEPLGVADAVKMGAVTLRNVPVIVAKWKALGQTSDGVVTTQMLKQFLSTVDYDRKRITLRERSARGKAQLMSAFGGQAPIEIPFFMTGTHLMFAKGSLNGHQELNLLLDSGLAASVPVIILDETVQSLGLVKNPIEGSKYYLTSLSSHGIGDLTRGATQALGNVIVEDNAYWSNGFLWDGLISHQYLRHLGSWTIDFDAMRYYFPAGARTEVPPAAPLPTQAEVAVARPESYAGSYEVAPGTTLEVSTESGRLFLRAPGQQRVGLVALADGTFSIPVAGAAVVFERDASGEVTRLVLRQAGRETRATRVRP